jgi:hypothetical protein
LVEKIGVPAVCGAQAEEEIDMADAADAANSIQLKWSTALCASTQSALLGPSVQCTQPL